jgi:hypothetical protein
MVVDVALAPTGEAQAVARRHRALRPPGIVFYLAVGLAVLVGIDASSLRSFGGRLLTEMIWWPLAAIWGVRLLGAAYVARLRFRVAEWVRWLGAPLILGAVYVWTQSGDGPFATRLALSRSAMDQAAAEIIAGGSTDRDWIGLWPVLYAERLRGGMRFEVSGCGFIDGCGFAYSTSGSRTDITDPEETDTYEHLDGNWFFWTSPFD